MLAELGAIQAAANGLKSAGDILKNLKSAALTAEIQAKIIELQTVILAAQTDAMSAQASQMELLERVRGLEDELKRLENWETEKERYHAERFDPGVVVYPLKQSFVDAGEPPHMLCPKCYQDSKKSLLQATADTDMRYRVHVCPACKTQLSFNFDLRKRGSGAPAPENSN